jgi:hypothetical protein
VRDFAHRPALHPVATRGHADWARFLLFGFTVSRVRNNGRTSCAQHRHNILLRERSRTDWCSSLRSKRYGDSIEDWPARWSHWPSLILPGPSRRSLATQSGVPISAHFPRSLNRAGLGGSGRLFQLVAGGRFTTAVVAQTESRVPSSRRVHGSQVRGNDQGRRHLQIRFVGSPPPLRQGMAVALATVLLWGRSRIPRAQFTIRFPAWGVSKFPEWGICTLRVKPAVLARSEEVTIWLSQK